MLEMCTDKLGLPNAARRIFMEGGAEVRDESQLDRDMEVYISMGENYKDPYTEPRREAALQTILCPIISWHSHFPGLLKK